MEKNKVYKNFMRFLKEHKAYSNFRNNFYLQSELRRNWCNVEYSNDFDGTINENNILDFCNKINEKKHILNFSFSWSNTPEGHLFWYSLAHEWMRRFL